MPNFGYVTVYSRSGSVLRTSPDINLSSYTVDSFLTYMAEQGGPDYITTVSTSLGGAAVSGSENLSYLTGGSTLDLYDVTPIELVGSFYLNGTKYNIIPPNGTTGQVMTKTSSGYNWQNASGGLQVAPNSPITGIKYVWYGTEADYANLSQYYTDVPGDTEFHTF